MKKLIVLLLLCVLMLPFAACVKTPDSDTSNQITVLFDNKDTRLYQKIIERFETDFPQYKVNPIWTGGDDIQTTQVTKIGNGTAPDIIVGGDMYTEIYRRNLVDLTEYIERDKEQLNLDDIVGGVMDHMKNSDGQTVFLPRSFNCSFLYYNRDLFDAKRAELLALNLPCEEGTPENERHYPNPQWTIADFFKAGGVLTVYENGNCIQWGSETLTTWWGEWLIHVRQSGGDLFDADGNVSFDNDNCKKAMQIMRDKSYGNPTNGRPKITYAPGETDFSGFQGGKVAMVYGGHTNNWIRYDEVGLNWGMTVLPTGLETRNGAEYAIEGYGISKTSKNKQGAWEFIKYLNNKNAIDELVEQGGLPIRVSSLNAMQSGERKNRCTLALEAINPNGKYGNYACTLPRYEYFVEIANTVASAEIGLMMSNDSSRISIDQCVKNIQTKGNNLIEINYR